MTRFDETDRNRCRFEHVFIAVFYSVVLLLLFIIRCCLHLCFKIALIYAIFFDWLFFSLSLLAHIRHIPFILVFSHFNWAEQTRQLAYAITYTNVRIPNTTTLRWSYAHTITHTQKQRKVNDERRTTKRWCNRAMLLTWLFTYSVFTHTESERLRQQQPVWR